MTGSVQCLLMLRCSPAHGEPLRLMHATGMALVLAYGVTDQLCILWLPAAPGADHPYEEHGRSHCVDGHGGNV